MHASLHATLHLNSICSASVGENELLTPEAYFKWKGVAVEGLVTDGRYRGYGPIMALF